MQTIKYLVATFALIITIVFSANGFADENFNQSVIVKGIISKVDIANNSFTVVEKKTGKTETYKFPKKIKVRVDGKTSHDISLIKSGHSVTLKFKQSHAELAPALKSRDSESMTLKGTILKIDRDSMTGTVRQDRTKKIMKFRYDDELKQAVLKNPKNRLPRKGEKVTFAYQLESLTLNNVN